MDNNNEEWDVIYSYSRAQAIVDGILVDISKTAKEAGFKYNCCVTSAVWTQYIVPPPPVEGFQDLQGRLWDLLTMLNFKAKSSEGAIIFFEVIFLMKPRKRELIKLMAVCGPGDDMEPVITIMMPGED